MIVVTVPDGAIAGSTFRVVNPENGSTFDVVVPEGVEPGQTLNVSSPLSVPVQEGTLVSSESKTQVAQPTGEIPPQGVTGDIPAAVVVIHQQPLRFQQNPMRIKCPNCGQETTTRTTKSPGVVTWGSCVGLACIGCWCGCCLIPFFVDDLKDTSHFCPQCNAFVGRHNFIS